MESIQILNTAIIKSKEKKLNQQFEERLREICNSPALEAINKAISIYADSSKITRDQAAMEITETIRELDNIWGDYITVEGIDRLKNYLKGSNQ